MTTEDRLWSLALDAFPVMLAHARRHERKADNDRQKEVFREMHANKAESSNDWLRRYEAIATELNTQETAGNNGE